jgi:hypothetical protein
LYTFTLKMATAVLVERWIILNIRPGSTPKTEVIQSDQKVTQPMLRDLLVVAIQCNSIGLITHNITVTIQEPTQVTSCCNHLAPVRQLFFNSRSARMSFSQVQQVFIVEHYLARRSYLTCQNDYWLFIVPSTHIFWFFKFFYLWWHVSVLIYHLKAIFFPNFANN